MDITNNKAFGMLVLERSWLVSEKQDDLYAVAIIKSSVTVGHVPPKIYFICLVFRWYHSLSSNRFSCV